MKKDFTYRNLILGEVEQLVNWAANEGWNPSPFEAKAFFEADPEGFVGFFDGNELIAGGAIVAYGEEYGFMGLFIVQPTYRKQGLGKDLWYRRRDALKARLNHDAPIGMDGVVAMQEFYARGGFNLAFRDERYECIGSSFSIHPSIRRLKDEIPKELEDYDRECFGFNRSKFLHAWLKMPESTTFIYEDSRKIQGYAHLRKVMKGYKIGPLFANNKQIATELYHACLDRANLEPVYLDIPGNNPIARELVQDHQAQFVFECGRMYLGETPKLPHEKIIGITSFELG